MPWCGRRMQGTLLNSFNRDGSGGSTRSPVTQQLAQPPRRRDGQQWQAGAGGGNHGDSGTTCARAAAAVGGAIKRWRRGAGGGVEAAGCGAQLHAGPPSCAQAGW